MPTTETPPTEVPQYRVLQRSFFAPDMVEAGSIIRYRGNPGNHLEPLNDSARAAMEEWYSVEMEELNEKGQKTGQKVRPRELLRARPYESRLNHVPEVIAVPKKENVVVKTLAELSVEKKATEVRPPPMAVPSPAETEPTALGLQIEKAAAPPPSTVMKTA